MLEFISSLSLETNSHLTKQDRYVFVFCALSSKFDGFFGFIKTLKIYIFGFNVHEHKVELMENNNALGSQQTSFGDVSALSADKFKTFFDQDERLINEHEFRKAIFKGFLSLMSGCLGNCVVFLTVSFLKVA
jgi:hypothetical protein